VGFILKITSKYAARAYHTVIMLRFVREHYQLILVHSNASLHLWTQHFDNFIDIFCDPGILVSLFCVLQFYFSSKVAFHFVPF
jgi:hypothetical protein